MFNLLYQCQHLYYFMENQHWLTPTHSHLQRQQHEEEMKGKNENGKKWTSFIAWPIALIWVSHMKTTFFLWAWTWTGFRENRFFHSLLRTPHTHTHMWMLRCKFSLRHPPSFSSSRSLLSSDCSFCLVKQKLLLQHIWIGSHLIHCYSLWLWLDTHYTRYTFLFIFSFCSLSLLAGLLCW